MHEQQCDTQSNIHYDLLGIRFDMTEGKGITCFVTFKSNFPELTGSEIKRTFDPEVTIIEILQHYIEDFPEWEDAIYLN